MQSLAARLAAAGCVAAEDEAAELVAAAHGDPRRLRAMADRRVAGEPLAWVTGSVVFAGCRIVVHPGVYVPRWQTEVLTRRAVELLAPDGVAVDLCTGSGAVAAVLGRARPGARVLGTDVDPAACRCAAANGVTALQGSLADCVPADLEGGVDLVTAVVPYVPTDVLRFLPRDVQAHEPVLALDGGRDGVVVLERAVVAARRLLRPGGWLLLELGGAQDRLMAPHLAAHGFPIVRRLFDGDGDLCGVEARSAGGPRH